jgi:L-fucono-1,5-lactonase
MIIDAHHHFWDPAVNDYPWLTDELAVIRRRFGPEDLAPLLQASGVSGTILVQTRSSVEETRDFLATAAATPFIRGVVGWVDLTDPAIGDVLGALRDAPGGDRLVGVRHQVHDEPDGRWLARDDVRRGIAAVADADLVYDLLVRSRELPAAQALVASMPDARFVVDHLAKPPIRAGVLQPWADLVSAWADLPNASWKLSGLVTEADWEAWSPDDLVPYVDHALSLLGPDRLIFGSDWPVCTLAASYAQVVEVARIVTARSSDAERDAIFAGNAIRVYRLGSATPGRDG